jgi:membrane protein YdbS with pleckstrin-like domain
MNASQGDQPHPHASGFPAPGRPSGAHPAAPSAMSPGGPSGVPTGSGPLGLPGESHGEPPGRRSRPAEQAFAPPGGLPWARVSPRFTWHRRISVFVTAVPAAAVGALLLGVIAGVVGALLWVLAVVVSCALGWIVAELAYRSWGFAERSDDLLVTHGVFVKRLVVVPYGRMQFVDVTAGLLEQWLGIATVRLHTAAAATDARIPAMPAADAALLRDRLAQKGEARTMGL